MIAEEHIFRSFQEQLHEKKIEETIQKAKDTIFLASQSLKGITSSYTGIFSKTIWARDTAVISMAADLFPEEVMDTLISLFYYQKPNGSLPIRIQSIDVFLAYVYGFFGLEERLKKQEFTPWYEWSKRALPARDTVYSAVLASFNLYQSGEEGYDYVRNKNHNLISAMRSEEKYVDKTDQLVTSKNCSDWGDNIKRKGKLASINLMRYQALRVMAFLNIKGKYGYDDWMCREFARKAKVVFQSCMKNFWHEERGCFTVSKNDNRLDTFANVFACLWLDDLDQCIKIQNALEREVRDNNSGLLKCYNRSYKWYEISLLRTAGMTGYGNTFLYPLFNDLNILAQVRIAAEYPNKKIARRFYKRAMSNFISQSNIYKNLSSFHEVLNPKTLLPAKHPIFSRQFQSHHSFVPSAAAYLAAANSVLNLPAP